MNNIEKQEENKYQDYIKPLSRISIIAGIFSIIISVLLLANYIQLKSVKPLENETIDKLIQRLDENPLDEELKKEIRAIDLLARKAFFTSQWQLRTGGYLLIIGVIITLVCLRVIHSIKFKIQGPASDSEESDWFVKQVSKKNMYVFGVFLIFVSIIIVFLSEKKFYKFIQKDDLIAINNITSPETTSDLSEGVVFNNNQDVSGIVDKKPEIKISGDQEEKVINNNNLTENIEQQPANIIPVKPVSKKEAEIPLVNGNYLRPG